MASRQNPTYQNQASVEQQHGNQIYVHFYFAIALLVINSQHLHAGQNGTQDMDALEISFNGT